MLSLIRHTHAAPAGAGQRRRDLLAHLGTVPDPRKRRGVRHAVATVLAVAAVAVAAGARSFAAIGEWVADASEEALAALAVRRDPATGEHRPPDEATVRRVLGRVDADALDTAVGRWLAGLPQPPAHPGQPRLRALALDGKTLCGSGKPGTQVHLLAVMDHATTAVLGQVDVAGKTNEVRREALCRIPDPVRRDLEDSSWIRWLTRNRKGMGTAACHDNRRSGPGVRDDAPGDPRDMAKAELPEPQSPAMQLFIHRKRRLKPVPCPASGYLVTGATFGTWGDAQQGHSRR
jgi:hypothetical protein